MAKKWSEIRRKKKVPRTDPKIKAQADADEMRPEYDLDYGKARKNTPAVHVTKIISIADECTKGCQLHVLAEYFKTGGVTDPHFLAGVLAGEERLAAQYKDALQKIGKACEAARGEGNFRLITIIKQLVLEALT